MDSIIAPQIPYKKFNIIFHIITKKKWYYKNQIKINWKNNLMEQFYLSVFLGIELI